MPRRASAGRDGPTLLPAWSPPPALFVSGYGGGSGVTTFAVDRVECPALPLRVYVNGVSDGSVAFTGVIPTSALPVRIGADQSGANTFTGWIEEVEIFNRALTPQEILAIRNAFTAGKCKQQQAVPANSTLGLLLLSLLIAGAGMLLRRSSSRG